MKLTNSMLAVFWVTIFLILGSYFAYAFAYSGQSHMAQALMQAEAAAEASDGKSIAQHAEDALTHAKSADRHLDAAIKSLEETIEHGNQGHIYSAKKAAIEAKTHLRSGR